MNKKAKEKIESLGYSYSKSLTNETVLKLRNFYKIPSEHSMASAIITDDEISRVIDYFVVPSSAIKREQMKQLQIAWNNLERDVEEIKEFLKEQA